MPKTEYKGLKPFTFHGVEYSHSDGDDQANGDCPFCSKEGKFFINADTTQWDCKSCGLSGNATTFIRKLWEASTLLGPEAAELIKKRKLLNIETIDRWGVRVSSITGGWLVPGFGTDGKLNQLYKYDLDRASGKYLLYATPDLHHQVHGALTSLLPNQPTDETIANKDTVYICEGPWDGMALWEVMDNTKYDDQGKIVLTSNKSISLLANAAVIAVPGANVFTTGWAELLGGKKVVLMYDSDHTRENKQTKAPIPSVGLEGMKRVAGILASYEDPPAEIHYLEWGPNGFDPKLPSGYDVRDWLASDKNSTKMSVRAGLLQGLLAKIKPVPDEWIAGKGSGSKKGTTGMALTPCNSWKELVQSWRKSMKWTEGLDRALSVMLSIVTSTQAVGDQLWGKIIGPPSCIGGSTYIAYIVKNKEGELTNKKGGSLTDLYCRFHNLHQLKAGPRWHRGGTYYVQSVRDDMSIIRNKIEDVIDMGLQTVYYVRTKRGFVLRATADHEFLTPDGYKPLHDLAEGSVVFINPGKPKSKSDNKPAITRKEVGVVYHPRGGSGVDYKGRTRCRLKIYQAVYEAHKNGLEYDEYVSFLNTETKENIDKLWSIPPGWDVHHKDEDCENNSLDNLELVDPSSHGRMHLENALKQIAILVEEDTITDIVEFGSERVYDIVCADPYRNFVAGGVVVHNCGKSTLCEAISVAREHIIAKSTIRGFHSGYKTDKDGDEDHSLIAKIGGKTLITKDGDTLLQSPNLKQILSEARDIYDTTSRTDYRHGLSRDYEGIRMTWILCGTSSLRQIDESELGARFIDCVIMEGINDELEDEILWRVVNRAERGMGLQSNGDLDSQQDPDMVKTMQLTGGYVDYLRKNSQRLLAAVEMPDIMKRKIMYLGKFVAYMRARPSKTQSESAGREFGSRLVSQFVRLAKCLAVVLNRTTVDEEVMNRVRHCALDTARGRTLELTKHLYKRGQEGATTKTLAILTNETEKEERTLLSFLRKIDAVELHTQVKAGVSMAPKWRLNTKMTKLYDEVMNYTNIVRGS